MSPALLLVLIGLAAPPPVQTNALMITDPAVLASLEKAGLAMGPVLGGTAGDTATMHTSTPAYRDLVNLLGRDSDLLKVRDPKSGVGFGHSHRAFDIGWLKSKQARFELVGVVNRIDRAHVRPGGCGERRLIYRLAYDVEQTGSRLPMTANVVLTQDAAAGETGCSEVAKRWMALNDAKDLGAALMAGPMAGPYTVLRVETNTQSVRYPSGIRPDLGGHAGYVMRVFDMKAGRLSVTTLENTPTVTLDGKRKAALRKYLRANLPAIESGAIVLPKRFLAKRSVSASPRGLMRAANRPYHKVLGTAKRLFKGKSFEQLARIKTADAAFRRLESMSCKGCHQSGSLAGFHLLGEERDPKQRWNALAVGASPHLLGELRWRRDFQRALAEGRAYPEPRPFAERTGGGGLGAACGLGDPTYVDWTCDAGLVCHDILGDALGACGPAAPVPPGGFNELSTLVPSKTRKPDRVRVRSTLDCAADPADAKLVRGAKSGDGFPGGMCHAPCKTYGERKGDAICGPVPFDGGKLFGGFTHCLARLKRSFAECIADSSKPTWLRACDAQNPCREDYLCTRVPNVPADQGACLPTYFLAQIRVDGHALSE